jgi:hypothetical protein
LTASTRLTPSKVLETCSVLGSDASSCAAWTYWAKRYVEAAWRLLEVSVGDEVDEMEVLWTARSRTLLGWKWRLEKPCRGR